MDHGIDRVDRNGAAAQRLDALLDQGLREGEPSTIVDFTGAEPKLIREGNPAFSQFLRKTLRKAL